MNESVVWSSVHVSMDEVALVSWEDCAAALKQCYADLGKRLTLGEILPELYSLRTITDYEKQEIEGASRTEYKQNRKLVDFLLKKGKREFRQFLQALDKVGRADLRDLLIASLKTELNVRRCIVVRSLNEDGELPSEELVSLWLEQEIGVKVDNSWLLDGHRYIMVRCGHDRDRQKALDKGRDVIDNHLVAFEVPDFLNKTDQLCSESDGNAVTFTNVLTGGDAAVPQLVLEPAGRDALLSTETCEPTMLSAVLVSPDSCGIRDQPPLAGAISSSLCELCDDDGSLEISMAALEISSSLREQGQWRTDQCSLSSTERRIEIDGGAIDSTLEETGFAPLESHPCIVADTVIASAHSDDLNFGFETENPQDAKPPEGDAELVPATGPTGLAVDYEDSISDGDERGSALPSPSLSLDAESGRGFIRLVLGEYHAASQYFDKQDESFLSLLKDINCSVPVIRADWGNLLVLDCFTPVCLPDNRNRLCYIATVVEAFFSQQIRHEEHAV